MVFFATTIDDFASQSFCGYAADNTLIRGQSTDVLRLVGQQFTVIRNKIPRNLSDLRKLLVAYSVNTLLPRFVGGATTAQRE